MAGSKWTYKATQKEAKKYKTRGAFSKGSPTAYAVAWRNGWLDELGLPPKKWTLETVKAAAAKFPNRTKFSKGARGAYMAARKHGWLDIVFPK